MNQKEYELKITEAPQKIWTKINKDVLVFKIKNTFALITSNISSFNYVSQWKSICYRYEKDNVTITGVEIVGWDLDKIKECMESEVKYLNIFVIPKRK